MFEERFKDVLDSAKEGELRCFNGKRWDANAVLIVVDASLDSIGLNYFKIVVPRVKRFYRDYVDTSRVLDKIREGKDLDSDLDALRYWAVRANHREWEKDEIGRINGVGLITFQYLRMQAGVDTSMPDKIIKRVVEREWGINAPDDLSFIEEMERLSKEIGYSQILICWAIWLRESDMGKGGWEAL
ncbi:MAG: hypothetical protein H8D26_05620 [Methanomicrobia archaeon]|nr:hypothetical protein [Methanomicrobia archaeon]